MKSVRTLKSLRSALRSSRVQMEDKAHRSGETYVLIYQGEIYLPFCPVRQLTLGRFLACAGWHATLLLLPACVGYVG